MPLTNITYPALENPRGFGSAVATGISSAELYGNDKYRLTHATSDMATDNLATGNLDFSRDLYKLGLEQDFLRDQTALNNAFNAEQARLVREENRYLSSTQYQRAKQDMVKAGLNPYLAYGNGGNAVGSVANASASPSSSPNSSITASGAGYAHLLGQTISAMSNIASSTINGFFGLSRAKIPNISLVKKIR